MSDFISCLLSEIDASNFLPLFLALLTDSFFEFVSISQFFTNSNRNFSINVDGHPHDKVRRQKYINNCTLGCKFRGAIVEECG